MDIEKEYGQRIINHAKMANYYFFNVEESIPTTC